jgi:hypothetical protein
MQVKLPVRFVSAGALLLAFQACWADDNGAFSIGTSANYSSGKYGAATSTNITSIPLNVAYDKGPWTFKASVPYVGITGPSDVIVGIGKTSTTASAVRTASGLGDVVTAATYNFYNDAASQSGADVTGKVKFGTADSAKGLGTGRNDYGVMLDVYKKVGQLTFFGGVGYTALGSTTALALKNVFNVTAGSTFRLDEKSSVGLAYDHRQKSSAASADQSELTAFYTHKFDKSLKTQAYVLKGFSNGSPDWGAGISLGYAF